MPADPGVDRAPLKRPFIEYCLEPNGALLAVLLALMATYPFAGTVPGMGLLIQVLSLAMTAIAILACWNDRWIFYAAIVLGPASELLVSTGQIGSAAAIGTWGQGGRLVFILLLITSYTKGILKSPRVTMNTVFAASSVYLLMALSWGYVFSLMHHIDPEAFRGIVTAAADTSGLSADGQLFYFSLITLTTVGFGDIVPLSPAARVFAALEGLIGQLFLAIIIARLVGLEIANRIRQHD